ncbi:MAG: acyltransferase [Chloroflexi bacterium]|nr:acyltransferase [Chloroflexota bacterium]
MSPPNLGTPDLRTHGITRAGAGNRPAADKLRRAMTAGPGERVPALDGLRGIAIAFVMLYHFDFIYDFTYGRESGWVIDGIVTGLAGAGWAGVDLFFVLSGFLITGILLDSKGPVRRFFGSFYARRSLRIFPAYYAFLLLLLLLLPLFDETGGRDALWDYFAWYALYLTNIYDAINPGLRADFFFVGHIWSLAVEEQFYLLWPAFVFAFSRRTLMRLCVAGILIAFGLRLGFVIADLPAGLGYTLMPARMDALAAGALIALAIRDEHDLTLLRRWAPPVAIICGGAVVAYGLADRGFSPLDDWVRTAGFTVLALLFASLLALTLQLRDSTLAASVLSHSALRWLGRYSYATYLVHLPVAVILARQIDFGAAIPAMVGSTLAGEVVYGAAAAAITVSVAWLSWQVLESQFLKLKRRFPYAPVSGRLETSACGSLSLEAHE